MSSRFVFRWLGTRSVFIHKSGLCITFRKVILALYSVTHVAGKKLLIKNKANPEDVTL